MDSDFDLDLASVHQKPSGLPCPICNTMQYETANGLICENYHKSKPKRIRRTGIKLAGKRFVPTTYAADNCNIILKSYEDHWSIALRIYHFAMDGGYDEYKYWSRNGYWYGWEAECCNWKDYELDAAIKEAMKTAPEITCKDKKKPKSPIHLDHI